MKEGVQQEDTCTSLNATIMTAEKPNPPVNEVGLYDQPAEQVR